jgi:RimJ/RimL family protein N-acetyltransferase
VSVRLRPINAPAAAAIQAGRRPEGIRLAPDYPTEFSRDMAAAAGGDSSLGPYFIQRTDDGVVVGEIGGSPIGPGTILIGYAIVPSCWGRGHATAAVLALVELARKLPEAERLVAHTPLERPASARVLEKAGFAFGGELDDEHEGRPIRVKRWERATA